MSGFHEISRNDYCRISVRKYLAHNAHWRMGNHEVDGRENNPELPWRRRGASIGKRVSAQGLKRRILGGAGSSCELKIIAGSSMSAVALNLVYAMLVRTGQRSEKLDRSKKRSGVGESDA